MSSKRSVISLRRIGLNSTVFAYCRRCAAISSISYSAESNRSCTCDRLVSISHNLPRDLDTAFRSSNTAASDAACRVRRPPSNCLVTRLAVSNNVSALLSSRASAARVSSSPSTRFAASNSAHSNSRRSFSRSEVLTVCVNSPTSCLNFCRC